jgi:hypothetical protein
MAYTNMVLHLKMKVRFSGNHAIDLYVWEGEGFVCKKFGSDIHQAIYYLFIKVKILLIKKDPMQSKDSI